MIKRDHHALRYFWLMAGRLAMRGELTIVSLSSRATESRECTPDDRLPRGIQYAAVSRLNRYCSGILGRPPSRTMTLGIWYVRYAHRYDGQLCIIPRAGGV